MELLVFGYDNYRATLLRHQERIVIRHLEFMPVRRAYYKRLEWAGIPSFFYSLKGHAQKLRYRLSLRKRK